MRLPLALLAFLLLAGCTGSTPSADDGPIALGVDDRGLLLLDTQAETALPLSETSRLGWMAPGGDILVWEGQGNQHVLSNRTLETVQPAPIVLWSRIEDDVTGIVMQPGRVVRALLTNGSEVASLAVPAGPRPDGTWSGVSTDVRILGAEWPGATGSQAPCRNVLVIHDTSAGSESDVTRAGCHLRVARDGRVGWTESTGVWIRSVDGTIRDVTGTGRDVNGTFVAHENPVFTAEGAIYLRLRGGEQLTSTEVVDDSGTVLATLEGRDRVALLDASADGRFVLLRVFSA